MIFVLPYVNNLLSKRYKLHALIRDLLVTRVSILFLTLGALVIGLAPNIGVFMIGLIALGLGSPFIIALRCVVTHLVPTESLGTLYTSIGLIQSLGMMAQGPVLAALFKQGLKVGITGMPYYFVAGTFAVSGAIVLFTPMPEDQIEEGAENDDGEPQS